MDQNRKLEIVKVIVLMAFMCLKTHLAFAEATSESDLNSFLEGVGDFLIRIVGPAVLVIGVSVSGISMALGDEQGMRRGALAAGGGALILLSRAVLAFIQNITRF